ncbi:MAG: class I SAM-dependent methyltransferase [Verrucomicrobiia bacterium]
MNRSLVLLGCLVLPAFVLAQDSTRRDMHEMHRLHRDSGAYIAMLQDPERDEYQKPHEVITALKLEEGEVIADVGAGSGYFTFRLARHVGESGRIYAVDVNSEMILHLNRRIRDLEAKNVVSILAASNDPLLADGSIDRFFVCNTWHHIDNRDRYLGLLRKMLKAGGQIVMIDFKKVETPMGPPMEMRIARDDLVKEMERNGFRVQAEETFLPYQYFLVFTVRP